MGAPQRFSQAGVVHPPGSFQPFEQDHFLRWTDHERDLGDEGGRFAAFHSDAFLVLDVLLDDCQRRPALRIHLHQQVHVVGHDFKLDQITLKLTYGLDDDLFQANIYPIDQHLAAVLGTPYDVVFTGIDHIPVRPEQNICSHTGIILHQIEEQLIQIMPGGFSSPRLNPEAFNPHFR